MADAEAASEIVEAGEHAAAAVDMRAESTEEKDAEMTERLDAQEAAAETAEETSSQEGDEQPSAARKEDGSETDGAPMATSLLSEENLKRLLRRVNSELDVDPDAQQLLISILDEAATKILRGCIKDVTFPSTASVDAALLHLVSANSKFVPLSLSYALTKTAAYMSDRSSCDVILPIHLVRQLMHAAVSIDGPASTDNAALDECAAYATAALEYLYTELLRGCQAQLWNNQFSRPGASSTRITVQIIGDALSSRSEWPLLFLEPTAEPADTTILLRIVIVSAKADVVKTVKVDAAETVASVCAFLKSKLKITSEHGYCLFLPSDETDETDGSFLDPQRPLNSYAAIRSDTALEFRADTRTQLVYTHERTAREMTFSETLTVDHLVKQVINRIGLRDPSRFGLLLLSSEDELRSAPPPPSTLTGPQAAQAAASLSSGTNRSTMSLSRPTIARGASGEESGGAPLQRRLTRLRPVSQLYTVTPEGLNRASPSRGSTLTGSRSRLASTDAVTASQPFLASAAAAAAGGQQQQQPAPPGVPVPPVPTAAAAAAAVDKKASMPLGLHRSSASFSASSVHLAVPNESQVVEMLDRADWLNPHLSLRAQGVQETDVLLLVRQKKNLSFYDFVNENPSLACDKLRSLSEELIERMLAALADIKAFAQLQSELGQGGLHGSGGHGGGGGGGGMKRDVSRWFDREGSGSGAVWIAGQSFTPPADRGDLLAYKAEDRVSVIHRKGEREKWYGALHGAEGWFDPQKGTLHSTQPPSQSNGAAPTALSAAAPSTFSSATAAASPASSSSSSSSPSAPSAASAASAAALSSSSSASLSSPSAAAASASAASSEQPPCEGYLLKRGQRFGRWKRRYYRVTGRHMWYYESERGKDAKPVGQINILRAAVVRIESGRAKAQKYVFAVKTRQKERWFAAESDEDAERWIDAIKRQIEKEPEAEKSSAK